MTDWSVDELMVAALARELRSDDRCINGAASFIPVVAIGLARRTTAPGLVHVGGAVGVDARWPTTRGSTVGPWYWQRATARLNHPTEFWPAVQAGRIATSFHRAAQMDSRGNLNNSRIGRVRLPGGAAMGDVGSLASRILLWSTTHNPRTLVERVEHITCPGYLDAPGDRERLGMRGGPVILVTDLAVLDFDPTGRLRLRSVHPGVTADEVQAATGFDLRLAGPVSETAPPSVAELRIIRALDPEGYRKSEFRSGVPERRA